MRIDEESAASWSGLGPALVATAMPRAPGVGPRELAQRRLRESPRLALRGIRCAYARGVLTLHGRVGSYYLKQLAQTAVAGIDGVQRLANEIIVAEHKGGSSPRQGSESERAISRNLGMYRRNKSCWF